MKKLILIVLIYMCIVSTNVSAGDWTEVPQAQANSKRYYSETLKKTKWIGVPDANYAFEGERLAYERTIKNEDGNDILIKTYKNLIEIIADFKTETKMYGVAGNIEKIASKKFGGALKGFIWIDDVDGGGEVNLPFTAKHIFHATGDRLNPVLTEIGTDTSADNWYEIIDGKTHVHVKSFSGIGGAAGAPPALIAHYKMNENTASDNDELVTNGNFAAWTGDDPEDWTVGGEVGADPEVSEVGTGEGYGGAGTGMCNIYTSDGTLVSIEQIIATVVGRKYRVSITGDTLTTGSVRVQDFPNAAFFARTVVVGVNTWTFVATHTTVKLQVYRTTGATDATFDDVSIKLCAAEDSSGNDHDMLMQQDTSAISVPGKINTAFDFNGSSDYGEIDDHDDFTPAGTPFSISVDVYLHDASGCNMISKGVFGVDGEWRLYTTGSGLLYFRFYDESAGTWIGRYYSVALPENQWLHIVVTSDGGTANSSIRIYLFSVRVDDNDAGSGSFVAVENLAAPVRIGRYSTSYTNGVIDNAIFFSVELTQDEVNMLYNAGASTEIPAELDPQITPRRRNLSPLPLRRRYEF